MTIYGKTLGVFQREKNKSSRNGEKTKSHKIKIVVFLGLGCEVYDRYENMRHKTIYAKFISTLKRLIARKGRPEDI